MKFIVLTLGFGKYKVMTPVDIEETDQGYLEWLRDKTENLSDELKDEIIEVLRG